jgi:hypothetical protein
LVTQTVQKTVGVSCSGCDHRLDLEPPPVSPLVCVICGNHELYKKKNFPHWLGLAILAVACFGFLALMYRFEVMWAWVILLGSAAFDGLLYLWVGDVIVCYRCGAHYYGARPGPEHKPFELVVGERYRQERLRREQFKQ